MVKVYDMAGGELLTDSTLATQHAGQREAGAAWSAPSEMSEAVAGAVAESSECSTADYGDVPELALQLIQAC